MSQTTRFMKVCPFILMILDLWYYHIFCCDTNFTLMAMHPFVAVMIGHATMTVFRCLFGTIYDRFCWIVMACPINAAAITNSSFFPPLCLRDQVSSHIYPSSNKWSKEKQSACAFLVNMVKAKKYLCLGKLADTRFIPYLQYEYIKSFSRTVIAKN